MAESSLQDRLRDHSKAFDGLLSLIPAKMYYGEDNTDQWNRKKQTKAQAAAARRGKLDPDSELNRNAKEVMDERAKNKRKLRELEQQEQEEDDDEEMEDYEATEGVEAEQPRQGLKTASKKQKRAEEDEDEDADANASDKEEEVEGVTPAAEPVKAKNGLSKKEQKRLAKKEKKEKRLAAKQEQEPEQPAEVEESNATPAPKASKKQKQKGKPAKPSEPAEEQTIEQSADVDEDMEEPPVVSNGVEKEEAETGSSAPESAPQSPTFDASGLVDPADVVDAAVDPASAATSISSTVPPSEKPKHIKIPADTSVIRARLAAKIQALRAARKADGPDGKPIRTRQELIESRRVKQAERKAHKQELRAKAKLEEARKREEALASNSPSVMSPAVELDEATGNFAFGRVAFTDGSQLSRDLSYVLSSGKRKGPSDPKTALLKVQNEKKRISELDEEKQKEIAEKEAWLTARRRAEGERIRDDEALLKKAVKRKEVAKKKSEKAWKERSAGVQLAQHQKQKKREDNIRKRREDKVLGKAGKKKKGVKTKKKARPGFEGSMGVGSRGKK